MKIYLIKDSMGNTIRTFSTYREASEYVFIYGGNKWTIKEVYK